MICFAEFKSRINATKVAPELLGEVMAMIASTPGAERDDLDARAHRIVDHLARKDPGGNSGLLAMAITIRLMALDSVMDDRLVKRWLIPASEPSITYVHADLLRVAVEEPVIEGPEGQPAFVIASFCRRLTAVAASRGRA